MEHSNDGTGKNLDDDLLGGAPAAYDPTIKCVNAPNTTDGAAPIYVTAKGNADRLLKALKGNPKLPDAIKEQLRPFQSLACWLVDNYKPSAERSFALRAIRQAKDAIIAEVVPDVIDEE